MNTSKETTTTLKEYYRRHLARKGFYVEEASDGALSFTLTSIGIDGVYATISIEEIEYHLENMDDEELEELLNEE